MVQVLKDKVSADRLKQIGNYFGVYTAKVALNIRTNPSRVLFPRDMEFITLMQAIGFAREIKMDTRMGWCSFSVETLQDVQRIFIYYPSKKKEGYASTITDFKKEYENGGNFVDIGTIFFVGLCNHLVVVEVTHKGLSVKGSLDLTSFGIISRNPDMINIQKGYIKLFNIGLIDMAEQNIKVGNDKERVRIQKLTPSKLGYDSKKCVSPIIHNIVLRELYHVKSPNNHYKRLVQERVDMTLYVGQVVFNTMMQLSRQGYIPQDWSQANEDALRKYIADMVFDKLA